MHWMLWMDDCWMEGNSVFRWLAMGDHHLLIAVTAVEGGLDLALVDVLDPGAGLAPGLVADHIQGLAPAPGPGIPDPGHVRTARALEDDLVPGARHHVTKARASHDLNQSEMVIWCGNNFFNTYLMD